ncbi:hypothetical protein, partial [Bradyrhizobium sp. NAS96.2]|uniref:hypothetical protein n=1 Tax=Bradyrhizobium sp. NAS96.2 TaxID=1680160 RepID=UPI001AECF830
RRSTGSIRVATRIEPFLAERNKDSRAFQYKVRAERASKDARPGWWPSILRDARKSALLRA